MAPSAALTPAMIAPPMAIDTNERRQALGEGHAHAGADRGGQAGEERVVRLMGGQRHGEHRRERGQ